MPQIKQQVRHIKNPSTGRAINTVDIIHANLDAREERLKVVVMLNDSSIIDFPVPTSKEIRDRFFYKKAKSSDKPARPPNKFFIFRTMFQGAVDTYKLQVPIVSGIASEVWKKSSPEVKEVFTKLSQIAKIEHSELNPGYVYKPYRKISKDLNKKEVKEVKEVKEINSMNSTHSTDSTQNFIITTSPCSSSSNYSSLPVTPNNYSSLPVTPTQPLWPITSQHTLPIKNHENYNLSLLSSQNMQSNISSYPEIIPSLLYPQNQITFNFLFNEYIPSSNNDSINQTNVLPLIPQENQLQYYQYPTPANLSYSINEILPEQQLQDNSEAIYNDNNNNNNNDNNNNPLTYYQSMNHQDSSPLSSLQLASNFSHTKTTIIPAQENGSTSYPLLTPVNEYNSGNYSQVNSCRKYSSQVISRFKYPHFSSFLYNSILPEYHQLMKES
ncbi:hypothetical protein Glove_187g102 [Diversispora epigaea]|uniref:HMG box domain-containing protein n=1 Tax=Diversispora epigaea TaxID=1348612 RepID=A0A397ILY7_9GLOM|nr:hypothetical protein Glove_187g102 [Diversispora epigaea]